MIVRPDFSRTGAAMKADARRVGQQAGDETGRGFMARMTTHFGASGRTAAQSFAKGFSNDGGAFSRVIATMAAKTTIAAAALAATAPGVAQLTAALIPATGAAVALPAALLAGRVAALTFKAAVAGVGDAITKGITGSAKEAEKALEDLPPVAAKFARAVIALKPRLEDLRASVAGRFFAPLTDEVKPIADRYFPLLQRQAPALAGSMGRFGEAVAQAARRSNAVRAVSALFDGTRGAVDRLRGAVRPAGDAISALISSTAPLLPGMANGFTNITTKISGMVVQAAKSGRIVEIYRNAITTLRTLGQIFGNVGAIIGQVWTASNMSGGNLLITIRDLTGQARAFLASTQGSGAVTSLFQTLAALGQSIKTGLGAALPAVAQSIVIATPLMTQLANVAGRMVAALAPLLPALTGLTVQILTGLLPSIISLTTWLEQNHGAVAALAPVVLGLVAAQTAMRIATVASTVAVRAWSIAVGAAKVAQAGWTAVSWLASAPVHAHTAAMKLSRTTIGTWIGVKALELSAWARSTAATVASTAAVVANRIAAIAHAAAVGTVTVAQRLAAAATVAWTTVTVAATAAMKAVRIAVLAVNAAMRANPIGAVITIIGLLVAALVVLYQRNETVRRVVDNVWKAIRKAIENVGRWFTGTLVPSLRRALDQASAGMTTIRNAVERAWNFIRDKISAVARDVTTRFNAIKTLVTQTLPNSFRSGVDAIGRAWDGLKAKAREPIKFVVNTLINPFLSGFKRIAGVFGVDAPGPIGGFEEGGQIPGVPSSRDNRIAWLKNGQGKVISNIAVATGEFVVNAKDTAKALPLLRWINDGMKGGPAEATRRIGRPPVDRAGDGSDGGWAFAKGGLVGTLSDAWDIISNPKKLLTGPFEAGLKRIPGAGMVRDLLVGMGRKLISGVTKWISGKAGTAGGDVGKAQAFVKAQDGKPYGWANAGPGSYDCSGIVSSVYNVLKGKNPYSHTFSTGSLPGPWFDPGRKIGPLVAGWAHPGQRGASANVGHMAGMIGGLPFESTGSRGVRVGGAARRVTEFAHIGAARAQGGMVELRKVAKVAQADFGRVTLSPGANVIYNGLGRPEPLQAPPEPGTFGGTGGRMHPDDVAALATAIGGVLARALTGTVPATRVAARQAGRRPR
jgi:hypothetical protein